MLKFDLTDLFAEIKKIAVRLKPKGVSAVRKGHPWVFEDSIEKCSADGRPGDIAVLFDARTNALLGAGLYDPSALVRVKILTHGRSEFPVGKDLLVKKIADAWTIRKECFDFKKTNAFRLIHGESDGFPGLVTDLYDGVAVVKIYAEAWPPWMRVFLEALSENLPELSRVVLRLSREIQSRSSKYGISEGMTFPQDSFDGNVLFLENGIRFTADVVRGQNTGFFLDQRDNRLRVSERSMGKRVLNVFSYSGGFSLYAAAGGAVSVVSVDINKHAAEAVGDNFQLNEASFRCPHEEIAEDAFLAMQKLYSDGKRFGVVIVDPPSFAKAESEVRTALNTYSRLAKAAVRLLEPGGTLVFASCSSRVSPDELFDTVKKTASALGRPLEEVARTSHAPDHPAKFRESSYLKCMYATIRS